MPLSQRYKELEKRLSELRNHLLPKRFSPTGTYINEQLDKALGYRLLVHAEIECYLEDRARDICLEAYHSWKRDKKPRRVIVYLMTFLKSSLLNINEIIESEQKKKNLKPFEIIIKNVVTSYNKLIEDNNGIKENNLLKILLPIGIDINDIDPTWIITMDSFGSARGNTAHKPLGKQSIDPKTELNTVKQIIKGLKDLDKLMNKLDFWK